MPCTELALIFRFGHGCMLSNMLLPMYGSGEALSFHSPITRHCRKNKYLVISRCIYLNPLLIDYFRTH